MKFRNIVITFIALFILGLIVMFIASPEINQDRGDMTYYYNTALAVSSGEDAPSDADVIYITDADYEQKHLSYVRDNALILDLTENGQIIGKIIWTDTNDVIQENNNRSFFFSLAVLITATAVVLIMLSLIYIQYIKPFNKLQTFAGQVAKGNLDFPLAYGKNDGFFGAFTESFDIMREQLKQARADEAKAQRAKQEMMAELSHDIRTPLSTINATCEVLEVRSSDPVVLSKTAVIKNKAGTIDSLITNMMNASLEDVAELKVEPSEQPSTLINDMIDNIKPLGDINVTNELPGCLLYYDPLRLEQVLDNVIGNSIKYAGTPIDITYNKVDNGIIIKIKDSGLGVEPEELSLLTQKFYRGKRSSGQPGSGLGLYLAKYFMNNMDGDIDFHNDDGFVAEIFIRKAG
ncbi:MAG: HAMP domain-containing histidine kinase [Clostridiales bacterium]|nr:HAMP domain-containing histidine kinase [Clostridiales bacterium]